MDTKFLFFDIDGTLWDEYNRIPESTVSAIRAARKNGHKAFINSGRTRAFIQNPDLLGIGFDGIVSGCGTMIEYQDDILEYYSMEPDYAGMVIQTVRSFGFRPVLEGRHYLYIDDEDFANEPYGKKLKRDLGERLLSISGNWGEWEISKLSCATKPNEHSGCMEALKDNFDFMIHSPAVVEMAPKGYSKGGAIEQLCRIFKIDKSDTIAFGDSTNDLSMLEAAGTAVVMGNGSDIAKNAADLVTDHLHDDGIMNACRKLSLI